MIGFGATAAASVGVAGALEAAVGEPPARYHPVALVGRVITRLEPRRFGAPRLAGTAYAVSVPIACALVAYGLVRAAGSLGALPAAIAAGAVLWVASSLRMLLDSARSVVAASDDDPEAARGALCALVGRETATLSPGLIRSAAVESLAENLSDGLVAPLSAFVALSFLSLPAAAAGAALTKAVNTMDSMLGYPGRFGWASARLDDLVMFVPARLSALLLSVAAGAPGAAVRARRRAREPASPNAGWPMGSLATALGVELRKPGAYALNDAAALPSAAEATEALAVTRRAGIAAYALGAAVGVLRWV
ncbi:adenosylcobinamide-phosphate synthase CbiB [Natronomonas sp.]|uniref:adenosylcobinamide-phosphate synthase CbiB n=1 Tax=Natronomonas sp. TaxID=2184060 RepID=UPI00260D4127|nr:adenosylcobinamide-phosphate synthase CbiB [Natronomonas sp.]